MCTVVCVGTSFKTGEWCENQGELRAALGGELRYFQYGYDEGAMADRLCLCPVDLDAMEIAYGFDVDRDDPFWTLLKTSP